MNVITFVSEPEKEAVNFDPWVMECSQRELLDCYSLWEPEVTELLKVRICKCGSSAMLMIYVR